MHHLYHLSWLFTMCFRRLIPFQSCIFLCVLPHCIWQYYLSKWKKNDVFGIESIDMCRCYINDWNIYRHNGNIMSICYWYSQSAPIDFIEEWWTWWNVMIINHESNENTGHCELIAFWSNVFHKRTVLPSDRRFSFLHSRICVSNRNSREKWLTLIFLH